MGKRKKQDKYQFSKIMVIFAIIFSVFFLLTSLIVAIFARELDPMIPTTIIGASGVMISTTFVWYFKKSQAENSVKLYLSAYKSIISFRHKLGLDTEELYDRIENAIIQNLDDVAESHMDNATELLEKVEVNV